MIEMQLLERSIALPIKLIDQEAKNNSFINHMKPVQTQKKVTKRIIIKAKQEKTVQRAINGNSKMISKCGMKNIKKDLF